MSARRTLAMLAVGRLLIGIAMLVLPEQVARRWLGRGAATSESAAFVRAAGGRDVAYALGSLHAVRAGDPQPWLAAGVLVDGVDSYATLRARDVPASRRLAGGWPAFAAVALNVAGLLAADEG
jgi:hypothetical protein